MNDNKFDKIWSCVSPVFSVQKSKKGGRPLKHNPKEILKGIYWILDTGAQWRYLPRDFPPRSTCHYWFKKWSQNGAFELLNKSLIDLAEKEGVIDTQAAFIDATFIRSKGAYDETGNTKCGKGSKMMAIVDKKGHPIGICVKSASPHESTLVEETIEMLHTQKQKLQNLIGDKAYDSDPLDACLAKKHIKMIAPHKKNRTKAKTQCDKELAIKYPKRHLVENFFALFQWSRRVVIRYEKKVINFFGFALFRTAICLMQKFGLLSQKQIDDGWWLCHISPPSITVL